MMNINEVMLHGLQQTVMHEVSLNDTNACELVFVLFEHLI